MNHLTVEAHVEKYWDVIDAHSLDNALMITKRRHEEDREILEGLQTVARFSRDPDLPCFIKEFEDQVAKNDAWRKKLEARIAELTQK